MRWRRVRLLIIDGQQGMGDNGTGRSGSREARLELKVHRATSPIFVNSLKLRMAWEESDDLLKMDSKGWEVRGRDEVGHGRRGRS